MKFDEDEILNDDIPIDSIPEEASVSDNEQLGYDLHVDESDDDLNGLPRVKDNWKAEQWHDFLIMTMMITTIKDSTKMDRLMSTKKLRRLF